MVGLVTDGTKEKILREDSDKLDAEVKARQHELGLEQLVPLGGQNAYKKLEDMSREAGHITDVMSEEREKSRKKREAEFKANRKSAKEQLRMILVHEERKSREEYESRIIRFAGGGFEDYEEVIRMMPYRVLLKKLDAPTEDGGIQLPGNAVEACRRYEVVCAGDECEDVSIGDTVMVERYSGVEIDSGANVYLVVFCDEIICRIEE